MIHHDLRLPHNSLDGITSAHWGAGRNEHCLLLQVDDGQQQARIKLTPEEALSIIAELTRLARDFYEEQALESGK